MLVLEEAGPFATKGHANISLQGPKVKLAPPGATDNWDGDS
jgi:hypothetical protein